MESLEPPFEDSANQRLPFFRRQSSDAGNRFKKERWEWEAFLLHSPCHVTSDTLFIPLPTDPLPSKSDLEMVYIYICIDEHGLWEEDLYI